MRGGVRRRLPAVAVGLVRELADNEITTVTDVPRRLDGRVVLITGATSGIGRATALLASHEGAAIAAIDVDGTGLDSTAEAVRSHGGQIRTRVADVAEHDDLLTAIRALAGEMGEFHGAFANAAVLPPQCPWSGSTGSSGIECST
jgi:NAD(P)-dependent dehydrogenase (short-subunit alcohol dehydrogenase family)